MGNNSDILIISFMLVLVTVLGAECPYKQCYCIYSDIYCDYIYLTAMPQRTVGDNTAFTRLNLDGNRISAIPGGSLPANLTIISLFNNPLTSIAHTAFDEMTYTLGTLFISNASFAQIPDAFLHLNALKYLHVSDSRIGDWNEAAMRHLGSTIEKLTLENVGLTSWPIWLQNYSHVTDLSISGSSISFLPDDGLDAMASSLRNLVLDNNSLTEVPQALYKLKYLITLSLEYNHISEVNWLPQAFSLSFLSLRSNNISNATQLSSALRVYGNSLYDIYLQDNQLTAVPDLEDLTHIARLDLTNNVISDPTSGSLPSNLTELNLGRNALASIPQVALGFRDQNKIILSFNCIDEVDGDHLSASTIDLDLGNNKIAELTDTSFPQDSKLISLYLNNNPITKISNLAFQNLIHLYKLDLQNTNLSRLPLTLSSLASLSFFDITGTADLECTCQEKVLELWVLSHSAGEIVGDCGDTNIYSFYAASSLNCP